MILVYVTAILGVAISRNWYSLGIKSQGMTLTNRSLQPYRYPHINKNAACPRQRTGGIRENSALLLWVGDWDVFAFCRSWVCLGIPLWNELAINRRSVDDFSWDCFCHRKFSFLRATPPSGKRKKSLRPECSSTLIGEDYFRLH